MTEPPVWTPPAAAVPAEPAEPARKPWWKQPTLAEALGRPAPVRSVRFADVTLRGDTLTHKRTGYPVAGAHARVETAGEIRQRITLTRVAAVGVFALMLRKKKDDRELYLTVTGQGFEFVVDVDPKKGIEARQFAAAINTAA